MVAVRITPSSIQMNGHACCRVNNQDIVCSAISALTCNLINSLTDLTGDKVQAETGNGMTVIKWEDLSDGGKLLVDSWFLGLTDINREYNCIQF